MKKERIIFHLRCIGRNVVRCYRDPAHFTTWCRCIGFYIKGIIRELKGK